MESWMEEGIFAQMGKSETLKFLANHPGNRMTYQKGHILHFEGDPLNKLELLIKGKVSASLEDKSLTASEHPPANIIVAILEPPTFLAPAGVFTEPPSCPVRITAIDTISVQSWDLQEILEWAQKSTSFLKALLAHISKKIDFLSQRIYFQSTTNLKDKLLGYLSSLPIEEETDTEKKVFIILPYSKQDLADFWAVTRPSLSRCFSQLEKEGIIRVQGRKIYLTGNLHTLGGVEAASHLQE